MIIGLIGGIGSGKSTVLEYLKRQYHADIIEADKVAKDIMKPGYEVFEQIKLTFPEVIKDQAIDDEKLAEVVFQDKNKLNQLNSITHPGPIDEIIKRIEQSKAEIIVVESAILIGSGIENRCDEIWFVFCEHDKRINRLMKDRGYSKEKAESIMKSQPADEEYNLYADEFIDNSYTIEDTEEKIDLILSTLPCNC